MPVSFPRSEALFSWQYAQRSADIVSGTDVQTAVIMVKTSLGIQMHILSYTLCHQQVVKEQK